MDQAKTDFEKEQNSTQATTQNGKTGSAAMLIKILLGDYNNSFAAYEFSIPKPIAYLHNLVKDPGIPNQFIACPWQPPEIVA